MSNLFLFDQKIIQDNNFKSIAGIDEAGRGPWAGPVVVAIAVLPMNLNIPYLNDSKKLSEKLREKIFPIIKDKALFYSISVIDEQTIDDLNILEATKLGVKACIKALDIDVDLVLIDGRFSFDAPLGVKYKCIEKGDSLSANIAAASVLAKVTRDNIMQDLHEKYPAYGFDKHKGYGTQKHLQALKEYGVCDVHRKSFKPIAQIIAG